MKTFKGNDGNQKSSLTGIVDSVAFAGDRLKESPPSASGRRHDPDNNPEIFDEVPF